MTKIRRNISRKPRTIVIQRFRKLCSLSRLYIFRGIRLGQAHYPSFPRLHARRTHLKFMAEMKTGSPESPLRN